jgi:HEAT repeat protein
LPVLVFLFILKTLMRPKVVLGLVLLALVFVAAAWLLKPRKENPPPPATAAAVPATSEVVNAAPPPLPLPAPATPPPHVLTDEERQDAIDAEVSRLQDWSRNDDPQSLSNILADLTSPEKDIREAAIEAAKQFGSTNAIPALKAAAMNSTDTDEQIELLQAANFLSLPSLSFTPPTPEQVQAAQQLREQRQAQRQAQTQQNQNQSAPPASQQNGPN